MKYEVKSVVCDYGLYEDNKLILICNSNTNALLIKSIMEKDNSNSVFNENDFNNFQKEHNINNDGYEKLLKSLIWNDVLKLITEDGITKCFSIVEVEDDIIYLHEEQ
jgi:hypothetical protein